jgi:hypothetical protein
MFEENEVAEVGMNVDCRCLCGRYTFPRNDGARRI